MRGFTLLEVVLSLALSIILLGAMYMAMDVQVRTVQLGQTQVENAQLARTLLRIIADDLRSTVVFSPADLATLEEYANAGNLESVLSEDLVQEVLGEPLPPEDGAPPEEFPEEGPPVEEEEPLEEVEPAEELIDPAAATSNLDPEEAGALAEEMVPEQWPGVYGSSFQLQIDVSRLPRLDQYQAVPMTEDGEVRDHTSDIKTVAYFVIPHSEGSVRASGLYRRELDRAATLWASEQGGTSALDESAEPLAPEVTGLQFRYYDGQQWVTEWNSNERGAPPLMIEIAISMRSARRNLPSNSSVFGGILGTNQQNQLPDEVYRLMVHLPAASHLALEEGEQFLETEQ